MQLKPIHEQVVVVVGATSGIGKAASLQFAQQGAKLVVSGRSEAKLEALVNEIRTITQDVTSVIADVSVFEQVTAIADKAVEAYGRLDTWVHAPAVGMFASFENTAPEEFQRIINVSLMGQVFGAMAALPHLKREGRGSLIHVSSMEGRRALPLQSAYSSAKHGVEGFIEAMRLELIHAKIPINVTSIKPAVINTPFWNNGLTRLGVKPAGVPPYYDPRLVADAIVYTASHPTRDFLVGDVARILDVLQRVSPGLVDALLLLVGFPFQYSSSEPKSETDPHNLYEPVAGHDQIDGDYSRLVIPSILDWVDKHPPLKWGTIAGVAALAFLAAQALGGERQV